MSENKGALVYNEKKINFLGGNICLTDMWKAAGKPVSSSPAEWQRSVDGEKFIEFISETLNMGISHVINSKPGKGGGTWGHWQVAFAYAKKLSPEFHAWVNQAAREKMEAIAGTLQQAPTELDFVAATARATALFRSFNFIGKLTGLDKNQAAISANQAAHKHTGVDLLGEIGAIQLPSPSQDNYLTPTQIGAPLGLSARKVNQILWHDLYLQVHTPGSSGTSDWSMTEKGLAYGRMFDTARKGGKGSQQQLKWKPSVVEQLRPFAPTPAKAA
ncbi:MAG: KilA-N domain-containing protein [Acetobacter sp.]|uniref:KilA-N domain-containing protein n=1 Tax=Acetobacter sp. TaxID=440 RepID=UPI003F90DF07